MKDESQNGFRDPTTLTKWTKWFLYAQIAVTLVAISSDLLEYQLFSDFKSGVYASREAAVAAAAASDSRQAVVAIIQFATFIVAGILILKWIHRANYNARQLGATDMTFTPGWSIGWYFIPVASLWKPYQAMKEIWKASSNPQDWKDEPVSSLLPWWWFLWIVSGTLGPVSSRLTLSAQTVDAFTVANVFDQVSNAAVVALTLLMAAIVRRIQSMQGARVGTE